MADDFIRVGDKALEAKIAAARNANEIRDILLADQQSRGFATKFDRVALPERWATAPDSTEAPTTDMPLLRRAVTVNGVTKIITAYSCTGLDTLENELRK